MNYIKEINSFYDWLETNTLSDSAIVLWHALMHVNNKAKWITEFAVAISTLETKTGLKKDSIIRARNRLQQAGRIEFKSRTGQQSALYIMNGFDCVSNNDTNCDTNCNANRALTATLTPTLTATINKLNKTKLNNSISIGSINLDKVGGADAAANSCFAYFENKIGMLSSNAISGLGGYLDLGLSNDVIIKAIDESLDNNARSCNYIDKVLHTWSIAGIKTVDDLARFKADRLSKQKKKPEAKPAGTKFSNFKAGDRPDFVALEKKNLEKLHGRSE